MLCNVVRYLRFIIFIFFVREDLDRFLWLHYSVPVAVSYVVSSAEEAFRVQVTIATVGDAIRAAVLVVELPVWTDVITESVCTWIKQKTSLVEMI